MTDWCPDLSHSAAPRYLALADSIEEDIASGVLKTGDRLPAQRRLAVQLGLDFTTVARGYNEARRRGVISSLVGSGTFVSGGTNTLPIGMLPQNPTRLAPPDFSMNLPPEPGAAGLQAKMQESLAALSADLPALMRYQTVESSEQDVKAASLWLHQAGVSPDPDRLLIAPGAQAALAAILTILTSPSDHIACESITYPGVRSLAAQMGLRLTGLDMDNDGILPDAFEKACKTGDLKALYLNPTIQNPTTYTIPEERRRAIANIAALYGVPILEDDPYSPLLPSAPSPLAALSPQNTWYIGSLSKTLGAGLRLAYVQAPVKKAGWQVSRALRTGQVMPTPLTVALATRWIIDGTAAEICAAVASESAERQKLAAHHFQALPHSADPNGFHIWLTLKNGWTRSSFASQLRSLEIGVTESDAFTVTGSSPEAVRLCLGGPIQRTTLNTALETIASLLDSSPEQASAYF
ncbi:PLP-dependent aminotransferase family protein [Roseibium sp.]|uniref:aminotransferase-like domain-containing protein n=1 Tax=Roseibium sp. TaxID=1936156 RepID=UPI003D0DFF1A